MATKYVTGSDIKGWLLVVLDGVPYPLSIPYGLKVDVTGVSGGREKFKVLEGIRKGLKASVKKPASGSQFGTVTHKAAAKIKFDIAAGKVYWGSESAAAMTDPMNPVMKGTWGLQIPDEAHGLGHGYSSRAKFATTWFRIGDGSDRYLHPGSVSAGCVTVTEVEKWDKIYAYLILARKGDGKNVGSIQVV